MCGRHSRLAILTVFLPGFSCLSCLLSSRILQNNLLDLYLVKMHQYKLSWSFFAKPATKSLPHFSFFKKIVALCIGQIAASIYPPPPRQPPGHLTFLKIIVQIPPYPGQNTVQMPPTRLHSGDQNLMPPPRGHFTGT